MTRTRFAARGFGLRPKTCRPSANTENSPRTWEKPLVPRVLPCWTHYINYKCNKIQFKSSLTTFYIQVLFSATDFSFDWVLKFYVWNQVVRYSSAGVALNSNQLRTAGNGMTFEKGLLSFRDSPTVGTTCVRRLPPFSSKLTRFFLGEWLPCLVQAAGQTYWLFTVYHKFPEIPVGM